MGYLILLSRQGKVRLAKWFTTLSPKDKAKIVKDVSQLVLARRTRMCNFLEYKDTKIVYRRYASLFFIAGCSSEDNELITLEIIHRYVEQMDKYYGNVCELDIIFSFTKAYYILDELLLAGELQESSKKNVLRCISQQDALEDMEYLSLPSFDVVTSALNFDTPDCHVTGSCDLYTTKAAGSDKKLYKNIQQSLESQHAALLKFGASLSPPQRDSMAASLNLSRSSPFGSFDEVSNRRTFAYLIATLNASHPDYDFSHVLRPADFKRERVLRRVMTQIDSTLSSVRPNSTLLDVAIPRSSDFNTGVSTAPAWGPQMWAMVDKEMMLKDCTVFTYQPADDPFDEEEGAIWALHYFFFNKALKRVCYLYVRGVPVMSHSPRMPAHAALSRRARASLSGLGDEDMDDNDDDDDDVGANKRALFWLGDKFAERITASDDDLDDGLVWNRDADGDVNCQYDEDYDDEDFEGQAAMDTDEDLDDRTRRKSRSPVRDVSEDIAARMELDV
ncbi:Maf1 regulator-domain-containing protein [Chaetomidium leptoderma]|uniref:AP-1 complex subunit sigma-1 n=1 Tax=Chaetomidium leptoderma TaxID=669021 RepID=A0AAN6VHX6_9PEZI|nr:Maf1 regulator-domain-containing protein [Chaetomidium leptoderma]